jgi:hypothetical protein
MFPKKKMKLMSAILLILFVGCGWWVFNVSNFSGRCVLAGKVDTVLSANDFITIAASRIVEKQYNLLEKEGGVIYTGAGDLLRNNVGCCDVFFNEPIELGNL